MADIPAGARPDSSRTVTTTPRASPPMCKSEPPSAFRCCGRRFVTLPVQAGIQEICDRTALVTGRGLRRARDYSVPNAGKGRRRHPRWHADPPQHSQPRSRPCRGGSANARASGWPYRPLGGTGRPGHYRASPQWLVPLIARVFNLPRLALLAYLGVLALVHVNWSSVLANTVVPHIHLSASYLALLVAVLATTISPCLFATGDI